jgi:hypothetical protein
VFFPFAFTEPAVAQPRSGRPLRASQQIVLPSSNYAPAAPIAASLPTATA